MTYYKCIAHSEVLLDKCKFTLNGYITTLSACNDGCVIVDIETHNGLVTVYLNGTLCKLIRRNKYEINDAISVLIYADVKYKVGEL